MGWSGKAVSVFATGVLFLLLGEVAEALYVDPDQKTLEIIGRAQSRVSFRLQDSEGFTQPENVGCGDLAQWRNLVIVEMNHDLGRLSKNLGILYPLSALNLKAKSHVVGRFLYEGVYDAGPEAFREVEREDRENIENFKEQYDLWEMYLDLARGPVFFRVGKQNLAWGETDVFRLLDGINPLDNTFGGVFEDLDDRRIPLWMLRGSYNFGRVGFVSSLAVEGFCVPGVWDVRVAPVPPNRTPYSAPQPESPLPTVVRTPRKTMSNSRWGVRIMGVVSDDFSVSLGHYRSYPDIPALRLRTEENPLEAWTEICFPHIEVSGGSLSFWEQHTDVVVRTEVAWFWDEPVFIPEINTPIVPLPVPIPGIPGLPGKGRIPTKDALKWSIGLDKNIWIRPLNRQRTFTASFQYFGSWVQDYEERMRFPLAIYPDATNFSAAKAFEGTFTFLMNTDYYGGDIIPQMVAAYDVRGVWMFQPSVNFILEPFRFMIQYSGIVGNMTGFGAFRDRDQITFSFSYLLN